MIGTTSLAKKSDALVGKESKLIDWGKTEYLKKLSRKIFGDVQSPFISVIIQCHDRKEFLEQAISSALNQTLDKSLFEIIVVKNFASDMDRSLEEKGIRSVIVKQRGSGQKVRTAARYSKGQIISILDDDDTWSANKLELVHSLFSENKNLGYYKNNIKILGSENCSERIVSFLNGNADNMDIIKEIYINNEAKQDSFDTTTKYGLNFNNSSISFRREILHGNLSNLGKIEILVDNFIFCCAISSKYDLFADSNKLTTYKLHDNNVSSPNSLEKFLDRNSIYVRDYRNMLKAFGNGNLPLKKYMAGRITALEDREESARFFSYLYNLNK